MLVHSSYVGYNSFQEGIITEAIFFLTSPALPSQKGWESLFFCFFFTFQHRSEHRGRIKNTQKRSTAWGLIFSRFRLPTLLMLVDSQSSSVWTPKSFFLLDFCVLLEIKIRKQGQGREREEITAKPNMNILVGESNDCVERYEWFFASGLFLTVVAFKFSFPFCYNFVSQREDFRVRCKLTLF